MSTRPDWRPVLLVAGLFACVRGPLHLVTWALPLSNDDAIPLLIARHVLRGEQATVLWNQPYNGTLDAYLLAPALLFGSAHAVFRAYEAACAAALVALTGLLAGRCCGTRAGWAAAAAAAVGSPYMALMAATGPTPNFLVPLLVGLPLYVAAGGYAGRPGGRAAWAMAGLVSGLAVWDSALAIPALAGSALGLGLAGARPDRRRAGSFLAFFLGGLLPLVAGRVLGASATSPVTSLRPASLWSSGLADLARAAAGLLGVQVPLVVDGPERAALPWAASAVLGASLVGLAAGGARSRRALPLLGWAAGLAAAFALSRRTGGDEVRYLYGLVVPVLALAGAGWSLLWSRSRAGAAAAAAAVLIPWVSGHRLVTAAWRDPEHPSRVWQVPPLEPTIATLRRAGVRSAYASLQLAGRLSLETSEAVIASQAWNERIPGDPLRFRDEVDLDPGAAWVLSPGLSRGMPRAQRFRELLGEMEGRWREDLPGELVVFRGFRPPFDESRPVPRACLSAREIDGAPLPAAVLDRDPGTSWTCAHGIGRGTGVAIRVEPPRPLSALVLLVALEASPLAVPWAAEIGGKVVVQGPAPHGLQWVNGVPRAGKQALLAVPLRQRRAGEVRLVFQGAGPPLEVAEVFVYGPEEAAVPAAAAEVAGRALDEARSGRWARAEALYAEAVRLEPDRAALHGSWARARWRAGRPGRIDVESLDDGGPELVQRGR